MTTHVRPPPPPVVDDRTFFQTHPHRSHRVRLAYLEELAEAEAVGALANWTGHVPRHVLVAKVAPDLRRRSLVVLREDWSGCGEARARQLWAELTRHPAMRRPVPVVLWGATS